MRTEEQLRDAFAALADRPQSPEPVFHQIMNRVSPTTVRRRRAVLVLAAVAVLLLALAVPTVLVNRTVVPADTRAPGNWGMVHRVNLPPGWEESSRQVSGDSESASYGTPVGTTHTSGCTVSVTGPARPMPPSSPGSVPVDVNGRPGTYLAGAGFDVVPGVSWRYRDDSWANVDCAAQGGAEEWTSERARQQTLDFARRVVFEPSPLRLPFRLRDLPTGYRVQVVADGYDDAHEVRTAGVMLTDVSGSVDRPGVSISVSPGTAEVPPGLAGWETDTVDGLPAVLSARDGTLTLNTQGHQVRIEASGGEPEDLTRSLWPRGRRALLVEIAESLRLAASLGDADTWFDATATLPR